MARGKFGERLKRERKLREVSLDELSKATRISNRFLLALENEDWGKLPGGVFGHGFVRSIARYLGLSEEALLGEYDSARAENLPSTPPKPEQPIPSSSRWIPAVVFLGGLLLLVLIFYSGRSRPPKKTTAGIHREEDGMGCSGLGGVEGRFSARAESYSPRSASSERPR